VQWRLVVIGVVIVGAIFLLWPKGSGDEIVNLKLGLDLKGGSHLVMRVVTDDAVSAETDLVATRVGEILREEGFTSARADVEELGRVRVSGIEAARIGEARTFIEDDFEEWSVSRDDDAIEIEMPDRIEEAVRDSAVQQARSTIANRIDEFGVAEASIQRVGGAGSQRILLQLPGVEDPARVKALIQTQAKLEYRMAYYPPGASNPVRGLTEEDVLEQLGGTLPPGVEILPLVRRAEEGAQREVSGYMAVQKTSIVTGRDIADARRSVDQFQQPVVSFRLKVDTASRFAVHTRNNIGKIMPVVLDGRILSDPVIQSEIGANGQISGRFTQQEAEDLATSIRAGALPARVVTIEERTVGPSLGLDSIKQGIRAIVLGFVLVLIFMGIYYKVAGFNAIVALILNLLIIGGVMAFFGATLTLPGIAGLILTVGMAVDANVLIFERIREELRSAKTVRGSLEGGFGKALSAILDANITTMIAALMLFSYGTGPVRGFAVTLMIGILASLFTAIFVSRTLFELFLGAKSSPKLSI
jgi:preprotein translocase subunit SecD